MRYVAPVDSAAFAMKVHADAFYPLDVRHAPTSNESPDDEPLAVLGSFGRFVNEVFAPLHASGDRDGARVRPDGSVALPEGFDDAYRQFAEGGWQGLRHDERFGGAGLSDALAAVCMEMANGACMSLALAPLLTDGAIEAISFAGSDTQRERWLPKLVSGAWCGTMNLTESQAGSDLAALRCRAIPLDDGTYAIDGTKILISYGDHQMSENILHLVLARLLEAPAGTAGISLFAVPKWRETAAGRVRNGVTVESIERKLGLHGSPTAMLRFGGDAGVAVGELIGTAHRGLDVMFVMMNAARFGVGVQAVGMSERACQAATAYARERVQSRRSGERGASPVTIDRHPDVQRMLLTMRALTDGGRALYLYVAGLKDAARREAQAGGDVQLRAAAMRMHELLVPVVKGWCTEQVQLVTSLAIQVLGGHGYIEDSGVAQLYRDARILALYEGTTGIQANDLMFRKVLRDRGALVRTLLMQIWDTEADLLALGDPALAIIRRFLMNASEALERATNHVVDIGANSDLHVAGSAVEFLMLLGDVVTGWRLAEGALYAARQSVRPPQCTSTHGQVVRIASFFAEHVLAKCPGRATVIAEAAPLLA